MSPTYLTRGGWGSFLLFRGRHAGHLLTRDPVVIECVGEPVGVVAQGARNLGQSCLVHVVGFAAHVCDLRLDRLAHEVVGELLIGHGGELV